MAQKVILLLHTPASYFIDTCLLITVISICFENNKIAVIEEQMITLAIELAQHASMQYDSWILAPSYCHNLA